MLQQLQIHNYAIIDWLEINFSGNLNIITGETGAGKSILMGALGLILGERADTSVLLDKGKKCFIEGVFKTDYSSVKNFLLKNDLDAEQEMLIRREISTNGKSRAFINDTPVTLVQLKQLSQLLVDLHQQFDTLELNNNDFHREVIDALAGNGRLLEDYQSVFKKYKADLHELEKLKTEQLTANKEFDYNQFLFDELNEADFSENEIENIDSEIKLMSNAENIKSTLSEIYFAMEESEQPLVQQIRTIHQKLQTLQKVYPEIENLSERLSSVQIELKDISSEIDFINSKVNYDEEKISRLNDRMAVGYALLKKHNVNTTTELIEIKNQLESELEKVTNLSEAIAAKEKMANQLFDEAISKAKTISSKRQKEIPSFEEKVNQLLSQMGMPNAKIKVEIKEDENLNLFGNNKMEFLFNGNLSSGHRQFEPVRKVASGGELSRLMLSIKSLVAKSVQLPTLIFDEIDSGISGEAARQVGIIIKELSSAHQVVAITHQPQIAAKANTHFFVYKEIKDDKIITAIKTLDQDERITAIATMLSGEKPTAAAFENAREMIGN
ncbi:DNA repair protein RecN [Hanamia caeni]|uniref:DNA repair protein RecN n=1 Tax=Hanamia caeni TaxID=2294116 RepID=A0A3M9NH61_9BACT|nr:DNA repair protein RecN [Hanamia caeni]RNI36647.1 DNA repair protein RecN [Hanamia caeni]